MDRDTCSTGSRCGATLIIFYYNLIDLHTEAASVAADFQVGRRPGGGVDVQKGCLGVGLGLGDTRGDLQCVVGEPGAGLHGYVSGTGSVVEGNRNSERLSSVNE